VLCVRDTGIGMDSKTQSRIFEPFFTTKDRDKGTGLGLSTVYGIVQQSGGHIRVLSAPGQGATFEIYLPRVEQPAAAAECEGLEGEHVGGGQTVLLVEDDQDVRSLARAMLEENGYTVLEAGRGEQALALGERHEGRIDLLPTDVVMPGMSGRELAQRLAEKRPALPVLFMSGYLDDTILSHGVQAPGAALLQKPFTRKALVRRVREVLESAA
jgi:CheY-like chemotaxis protein